MLYSFHSAMCHKHTDVVAQCCASHGQGSGRVHLNEVSCLGSEPSITNCSYSTATSGDHHWDVGVHCEPGASTGTVGNVYIIMHVCLLCSLSVVCTTISRIIV